MGSILDLIPALVTSFAALVLPADAFAVPRQMDDANAAPLTFADMINYELGTNFIEEPGSMQVSPCARRIDSGVAVSEPFHLLTCGHIVYVDEKDCRCGKNCQHTSPSYGSEVRGTSSSSATAVLPPISNIQLHDTLYCEVCYGIPFDRYIIMKPPSSEFAVNDNPKLRRSLALTRTLLQALSGHTDEEIDRLIAPLSFGKKSFGLAKHTLTCKHEVLSVPSKPCAVNCAEGGVCQRERDVEGGIRIGNAMLCQECVGRAGLVHSRYARSDAERDEVAKGSG